MARAIKLINAPVGLFDIDGELVLKTEYSTQHEDGSITPDCYIVDSGEYFWGGVDSVEERNNLMVTPIDLPTLTPPNEPLSIEQLREMEDPVWCVCKTVEGFEGFWCLCNHGYILTPARQIFDVKEIPHWVFYRRPPEGEEDT